MKKISLTQGKFALVDDEDFEFLNQWKWCFSHGYAKRYVNKKGIYMHRLFVKTSSKQVADHINRNKLDNRKNNLRVVSRSQNSINRDIQINNTSGYKGVVWYRRDNNWQAQIKVMNINIFLGRFESLFDAVNARRNAEIKYKFV